MCAPAYYGDLRPLTQDRTFVHLISDVLNDQDPSTLAHFQLSDALCSHADSVLTPAELAPMEASQTLACLASSAAAGKCIASTCSLQGLHEPFLGASAELRMDDSVLA
jgi:hypothetical protein